MRRTAVGVQASRPTSWLAEGAGEPDRSDEDGRIEAFKELALPLRQGIYQLHFELDKYFVLQNRQSFYPEAQIIFKVDNPTEHFHVPLLLCGFGFSSGDIASLFGLDALTGLGGCCKIFIDRIARNYGHFAFVPHDP